MFRLGMFRLGSCTKAWIWSIVANGGGMKLRQFGRKLQAVAALIALLTASMPALAESLSASSLPACCNSVYCPMHHHQASEQQTDRSIFDSHGNSTGNDCSMRACDITSSPVVRTGPFVLVTPLAMRSPAGVWPAQIKAARFAPFVLNIPLTPPPRTLPS